MAMNIGSLSQAALAGYGCATIAYLVLTLLVALWWRRTLTGLLAALASLATCLWAVATGYQLYAGIAANYGQFLEIMRSALWSMLLLSLLNWLSPVQRSAASAAIVAFGLVVAVTW